MSGDDHDSVGTCGRPSHLLKLVHALTDQRVCQALCRRSADWQSLPIPEARAYEVSRLSVDVVPKLAIAVCSRLAGIAVLALVTPISNGRSNLAIRLTASRAPSTLPCQSRQCRLSRVLAIWTRRARYPSIGERSDLRGIALTQILKCSFDQPVRTASHADDSANL
jgi:hypothetical protein